MDGPNGMVRRSGKLISVKAIVVTLGLLLAPGPWGGMTARAADSQFTLGGLTLSLTEATAQVDVYYRAMRLDRATHTWNVEVTVSNKSPQVLQGPFVLLVDSFVGTAGPLGPDGLYGSTPPKAFYDLSSRVPAGSLAPGQGSVARTITLGMMTNAAPRLVTRFFMKPQPLGFAAGLTRSLSEVGQPLASVQVIESGPLGVRTNLTDSGVGVITLGSAPGAYTWQFAAPGYLPVWRQSTLKSNSVASVPSPRLTRRDTNVFSLTPIGGGTLTNLSNTVQIAFPAAAFVQSTTGQLTALNGQTLPAVLPQGWSPLQAFWLELGSEPRTPAMASITPTASLSSVDVAALVQLNPNTLGWGVLQTMSGNGTNTLAATVPGSGAYAVVVGDAGALGPPPATVGDILRASQVGAPDPNSLTASGVAQPPVSSASVNPALVTATAQVTVSNQNGMLPSGLTLHGEVTDHYRLLDGSHRDLPQYENSIVAYHRPGNTGPATLEADFPLRPLLLLGPEQLDTATVHVDVLADGPFSGGILDNTGGQVASGDVRILAGAGDIVGTQAVQIETLNPTNFAQLASGDLTVVRAFDLAVSGIAAGHHLLAGFGPQPVNRPFVLARVLTQNGIYGIEPRERMATDAQGTLSSVEPPTGERLPGITESGEYLLLQVRAAQGLVTGIARNSQGQAAPGLAVRLDPWLTFSAADGSYRLLAPTGTVSVSVTDLASGDAGQVSASVSNPQTPVRADLGTLGVGPGVVSVSPVPGAVSVPRVSPITISFSEPVNPGTLLGTGVQLFAGPTNQLVPAALTLNLNNTVATLLPTDPLDPYTLHTLVLATNIADLSGRLLTGTNRFTFTTANDNLIRPPGAEIISHEPTNGIVFVEGTQGIADANVPVILVDDTTGQTSTTLSLADGSFTGQIAAGTEDRLRAVFVNQNGTRNEIPIGRQVFSDGSVALYAGGGSITASNKDLGIVMNIPPGAIPGRTKFKIDPQNLADLQVLTSNTPPAQSFMLGMFNLTVEGDTLHAPVQFTFRVNDTNIVLPPGRSLNDVPVVLAAAHVPASVEADASPAQMAYDVKAVLKPVTTSQQKSGKGRRPRILFEGLYAEIDPSAAQYMLFGAVQYLNTEYFGRVQSAEFQGGQKIVQGTAIPLAGATVRARGGSDANQLPFSLQGGEIYTTSDLTGHFSFLLPQTYIPGAPFGAGGYVLIATHPNFPHQFASTAAVRFDPMYPFGGGVISFDRSATNGVPPPNLVVTHTPSLPQVGQLATIRVEAIGGTPPVASSLVIDSVDPPGVTALLTSLGGSLWKLDCRGPAKVVLKATAVDGAGKRKDLPYAILFGQSSPPPAPGNDPLGPRVVFSQPDSDSVGQPTTTPIILDFNKPVDPDTVAHPSTYMTLFPSAGRPWAEFGQNHSEVVVHFAGLQNATDYTLTVQSVRDLNGQVMDQDPATNTPPAQPFILHFQTAPEVHGTLANIDDGGGVVMLGSYVYVIDRGRTDPSVHQFDVSIPAQPVDVAQRTFSGPPRALALVPEYRYATNFPNGLPDPTPPTEPERGPLLAITGQTTGQSVNYLRVLDLRVTVDSPASVVGSAIFALDQTALITRLAWSAPYLIAAENNLAAPALHVLNMQSVLLADAYVQAQREHFPNGRNWLYFTLPTNSLPGLDINGNGDFVDPGDQLPVASRYDIDFTAGEVDLLSLSPNRIVPGQGQMFLVGSGRFIEDVVVDGLSGYIGALVTAGIDQIAPQSQEGQTFADTNRVSRPAQFRSFIAGQLTPDTALPPAIGPGGQSYVVEFPGYYPKSALLLTVGIQRLVLANLVSVYLTNNLLSVLDVTRPDSTMEVNEIPLPVSDFGLVQGATMDNNGHIVLSTADTNGERFVFLDPNYLLAPTPVLGPHPAIIGVVPGTGSSVTPFVTQASGVSAVSLRGSNIVTQTSPLLRLIGVDSNWYNAFSGADLSVQLPGIRAMPDLQQLPVARHGTNSNLIPPDPKYHWQLLLEAPGGAGRQISLAMLSLDEQGNQILRTNGLPPPAVLPDVPLHRLSDDKFSPAYNVYLSRPLVLVSEDISQNEMARINAVLARQILYAGAKIRVGIPSTMSANPVLGPFAGTGTVSPTPTANAAPVRLGVSLARGAIPNVDPELTADSRVTIHTTVDDLNDISCPGSAWLNYAHNLDCKISLFIDGQPARNVYDENGNFVAVYTNVPSLAGAHRVLLDSAHVDDPGEYPFDVTGTEFAYQPPNVTLTASGILEHEVENHTSFPIGHTIISGVDIWDGHLTHSRQDVAISGRRLSLDFTRSYSSSGDSDEGPLGAGWTHSYNIRLVENLKCGTFTVIGGDGSGNSFVNPQANAAREALYRPLLADQHGTGVEFFTPQIGYHSTLLRYTNDASTLFFFTKAGIRYKFQFDPLLSAGPGLGQPSESTLVYKLLEIREPNGNRLILDYLANGDTDARTLDQVTEMDPSGVLKRGLAFVYTNAFPNPRIVRMTGVNTQTGSDLFGLDIRYSYDDDGNLTNVVRLGASSSDTRTESYTYTSGGVRVGHNMTSYTDPNGSVTTYEYVSATVPPGTAYYFQNNTLADIPDFEKIKSVRRLAHPPGTSPDDVVTAFEYPSAQVRIVHDPREAESPTVGPTTYSINIYGATTNISGPLGQTTEMRWATDVALPPDEYGRTSDVLMVYKKDAEGQEHIYEYTDGRGNLTKETTRFSGTKAPVTLSDGTTTVSAISMTYGYDPLFNERTNVVDAEGHATFYEIDPATGNLMNVTDAEHEETQYHYDINGDLLQRVDPRLFATVYANYDIYGNAQQVTDGAHNVTALVYDERSRLRDSSGAFGHHTTYDYDGLDRKIREEHLDGLNRGAGPSQVSGFQYLADGEIEYATNGLGHVTRHIYDALNRRVATVELAVAQPDGSSVDYTNGILYDHDGNVIRRTDQRGIVSASTYDELNRRVKSTLTSGPAATPSGLVVFGATYDRVDNLLAETNLHGFATTYRHDGLYRVVETRLPLTSAPAIIRAAYDRMGNKVAQTDANGNPTQMLYDRVYRLVEQIDSLGNIVTNTYDLAGNKVLEEHLSSGLVIETPSALIDGLNRPTLTRHRVPLGGPGLTMATYESHQAYDDAANTVHTTNPRSFTTTTVKDGLGRVYQQIVNDGGGGGAPALTTSFKYDADGNLTELYDPEGNDRDLLNEYDGLNRKIRTTYLPGAGDTRNPVTEQWFLDGNGNTAKHIDKRGIEFTTSFDNLDRVLTNRVRETISNGGNVLALASYIYDDGANRVTVVDGRGNPTTTDYDELGRPKIVTDSLIQATRYDYDGVNRIGMTDKRQQPRAYHYDALNRLTNTVEFDAGNVSRSVMSVQHLDHQNGRIDTDRDGYDTISQFDALGRLVQVSHSDANRPSPAGALLTLYGADPLVLETREYDGNNNVTNIVDGNGNQTAYVFDGADRKLSMVEGAGSARQTATSYTYDNVGNLLTLTETHNGVAVLRWTNGYDARYRKISATDGEHETTTYAYDENNNLTRMIEPLGAGYTTAYRYDEFNQLLLVDETVRGGGTTIFQYDNNRNKTSQQDADTNLVTYTYDALNRLATSLQHTNPGALTPSSLRTDPPGGGGGLLWQYAYDPNNSLTNILDARGQVVGLKYDWLDRLVRRTYSGHAEKDLAGNPLQFQILALNYAYDNNGNLTNAIETKAGLANNETNLMVYDGLNRLITQARIDYDGSSKSLISRYDVEGNRTNILDPDGLSTAYAYDSRNRLTNVTMQAGTPATTNTTYEWWEDSLLKRINFANGTVADHSGPTAYDGAKRPLLIINQLTPPLGVASRYEYRYDANGNRTNQLETQSAFGGGAAQATVYAYDLLNRLTNTAYGANSVGYTYSPNGNRLTETGVDPVSGAPINRKYHYEPLAGSPGGTSYGHVNALSRIQDLNNPANTIDYGYDENLNQTNRAQNGLSRGMRYDIRDQLIETTESAIRVAFDYNFERLRVKKISAPNETRYLYDQSSVLVEYDGSPSHGTIHKYDYGYHLLSISQPTSVPGVHKNDFYLTDALGSTANLSDDTGALKQSYLYDAWGRMRDASGTSDNPRQYTGHYKDSETGLHYFGARYYDDEQGRFLSQDPYLGNGNTPPSLHRYAYAYNQPLRFVDLTGYAVTMTTEGPPPGPKPAPNKVIDPETGEEHTPWWERTKPKSEEEQKREAVEEERKRLERKRVVDAMVAPLEAQLDKAVAARNAFNKGRPEAEQLHEEPGAYARYLYEQAGGPLANAVFPLENDRRPQPIYRGGVLVGYQRYTMDTHFYYDINGDSAGERDLAGLKDTVQPSDLIGFARLGLSLARIPLSAALAYAERKLAERAFAKAITVAGEEAGEEGMQFASQEITRIVPLSRLWLQQAAARGVGTHRDFDLLARTAQEDLQAVMDVYSSGTANAIPRILPPGVNGRFYFSSPDEVLYSETLEGAQKIHTIFHELSHAHSYWEPGARSVLQQSTPMGKFMEEYFAELNGIRAEIVSLGEQTTDKTASRLVFEQTGARGLVERQISNGYAQKFGLTREQILTHFQNLGIIK